MAYTAQRAGAVARARWDDVAWEEKLWRIPPEPGTKFKKYGRTVPLNRGALDALRILAELRDPEGFLFPARPGSKEPHYTGWNNLVVRLRAGAGVHGWTMHDWRTCFASYGEERLGISTDVLGLCLGHAVQGVTFSHYISEKEGFRLKERRKALEAWGGMLDAL